MPIAPQDARRWADRLELARSLGTRWPLAEFGSLDSLIYLVADGAYSTSIGLHHWGNQLQDKLADGAFPGMVRAFSYFSYGHHYLPDHTAQSLAVLRSAWVTTLDHLRPGQRVIPICFSLGAAVAMLGTMDWLSQARVQSAASAIPAMVLVAPAHSPSPALLDGYQQKLDAGELPFGIPDSLYDLADPTSSVRSEARGAFAALSRAGIALHVLFWPGDIFTEYHTQSLAGLTEYRICTDRKLAHPMHAPREHLHLRDDPETTDQLIAILRGSSSPTC